MAWLAVFIPLVLLGGLGALLWQGAREHRIVEAELAGIDALPADEAKALALHLLERPALFETTMARDESREKSVPLSVCELFEKYETIVLAEFWLGREALAQTSRVPGYVKIGEDTEFTEILVRQGDENIYVSYGDAPAEDPLQVVPSVWHKIVEASGVPLANLRSAA